MDLELDGLKQDDEETVIVSKQSKDERKEELHRLLGVPNGIDLLCHVYKAYFRVSEAMSPPTGKVMIARILSMEYPEG